MVFLFEVVEPFFSLRLHPNWNLPSLTGNMGGLSFQACPGDAQLGDSGQAP
jgi:hypothetical protein